MPTFITIQQFNKKTNRVEWLLETETHVAGLYIEDAVFTNPLSLLKFKSAVHRHMKSVRKSGGN